MTTFLEARDFLLQYRTEYEKAYTGFRWPDPIPFNWAIDWFDAKLASNPETKDRCALWISDPAQKSEIKRTFAELSVRSHQVASYLRSHGLRRGDRILMILGNTPALWEVMLASMKLGTVVIPTTTLASRDEISDRLERGCAKCIIAGADQTGKFDPGALKATLKISVGPFQEAGWHSYEETASASPAFEIEHTTDASDPMLLYFTSGTTAKPKLVVHSHRSYPVGSLSTLYWLGLLPGDIHVNVSSPGWAKHAWSSFFAPWNAEATVLVVNQERFDARVLLNELVRCQATTLCAPPTVWRLITQLSLKDFAVKLREVCAAGEPLNPEIITRVQRDWSLIIRDGYGQTETTALLANSPGQSMTPGAMGRPMPGYSIRLLDDANNEVDEGEICVDCRNETPAGIMSGYDGDEKHRLARTSFYRTSDTAFSNSEGHMIFVGRADDIFKSSDYRISPFELESVLIEHRYVLEAAVVPAVDKIRHTVPKAYILLRNGVPLDRGTALALFQHANQRLAPYKKIREIQFVDELPKTISGKIKRAQLRRRELECAANNFEAATSFVESNFPELRRS